MSNAQTSPCRYKHTENHLAVKIIRRREQEQRTGGDNPMQEAQHPSSSLSGRVRGGMCRGNEIVTTIVIQQGVSASDDPLQADNPSWG